MNPERWARIKQLFAGATELPAADREAFLDREGAGDAELIAEVKSLLASHETAGEFLEPVAACVRAAALESSDSGIGQRIGPYRLVEIIGTGGMGDVYKAVRDDDVYRAEVAIKLMRADVRSELAERRFKSERQILAALDHRNIARLLDGGTTPGGLPYVVMELVAGEPVDLYCNARGLDTRSRVQLFLQVCAAVSYAHQHLVVHRDLKPNNIFVTADGSVKLLDFGIAKLLEPDAPTGTATEETRTQFRAMTLEYASPEQVSGGHVTTVSDVYSLGVVLYRLLTGHSPYRATGGDAARLAEILGDTTPTRPSAVATRERRVIDADLDHILLMALRKEPSKRYVSVEQFANDLRNYLRGHAVSARRGTLGYRVAKFTRRHKVPIAAAVLISLSLVTGLGFAVREARIASAERATAQRHFNSVRKLANRLFDFHDEIEKLQGATKAREMLLKTSLEYFDALYAERGNDLELQQELANAYRRVASIQGSPFAGSTGDLSAADRSYRRAAELAEAIHKVSPDNSSVTIMLAEIYADWAYTLAFLEGAGNIEEPSRLAVEYAKAAAKHIKDDGDRAKLLINVYWSKTMTLAGTGKRAEAARVAGQMVEIAEQYVASKPDDERAYLMLESAYSNASIVQDDSLSREQNFNRSTTLALKAIATGEKLAAMAPTDASRRWIVAKSRSNLGSTYLSMNMFREALEQFDLAAPIFKARAADGADANAATLSLMLNSHRAWVRFKLGRVDEAVSGLQSALKGFETQASSNDNMQARFFLAMTQIRLGAVYAARSDWSRAKPLVLTGVATQKEIDAAFSLDAGDRIELDLGLDLLAKNP